MNIKKYKIIPYYVYFFILLSSISYSKNLFELPIEGATGFAALQTNIMKEAVDTSVIITKIEPGQSFKIKKEVDEWWLIEYQNNLGWIKNKNCFINLPDIIPSIIYENSNVKSSILKTSEKDIPEITGKKLYKGYFYNERLKKDEYVMAVIYPTAHKIMNVQKMALSDGNSLKIYETYRPYKVQEKIITELIKLSKSDEEVMKGINTFPWRINWFIATKRSNHQRGSAIDVTLVKIKEINKDKASYLQIKDYEEYEMPTAMHELSILAIALKTPLNLKKKEDLEHMELALTMTEGAKKMQTYFIENGLMPLASEWWHFTDFESTNTQINGEFYLNIN